MKITLAYDRHGLEVELPDRNVKAVLRKPAAVPLENAGEALRAGLRSPIGTGPLSEIARGKRNAVIVVSDVTRPVPNATILPPIIETLTEAGVAREAITILVATGLHGPNEGAVLDQVLGAEIAGSMNVANHDARAREAHTYLGTTACGTEVRIDSRYRNADVKVLTGLIEPHFMAGYSGGPKAILPGLAAADAIGVIHGYRMLADARCRTGNITDNPLREELIAAARMAGADFICNVTLSEAREITGVFCGDVIEAHRAGCESARRECTAYVDEEVDIAVTSSAGFPLDTTYYQACKGICAPVDIVRPGGMIVVAAGCVDGIGSAEFERLLMETGSPEAVRERLSNADEWKVDQWNVQMIAQVREKARVLFCTGGIPAEKLGRCLVEPVDSVERAIQIGLDQFGRDAAIAVIPEGPYVTAEVKRD